MNTTELRTVLKRFAKVSPGFLEWRTRQAEQAASANRTTADTEWEEQLASWARTLEKITVTEGLAVVARMEAGTLQVPYFGDIAQAVRRAALANREGPDERFRQTTYSCLKCRDTGQVEIWNPHFVEAYRIEFEKIKRTAIDRAKFTGRFQLDRWDPDREIEVSQYDPPNWEGLAMGWWRLRRGENGSPIHHVALCNCDCKRRRILCEQRDLWRRGERRESNGKRAGLPACGAADYVPDKTPLKTSTPYEDLAAWYAQHKPNSTYEWQPNASDYETIVGGENA